MVTGTNTGVGKTVVTAALARRALELGLDVRVVKPAQTGVARYGSLHTEEKPDISTIAQLSGCSQVHQLIALEDPLAPDTAARLRGVTLPSVESISRHICALATGSAVVLVEGSGGVAVRLDTEGGTLIDLASHLVAGGHLVEFVIVTTLALGTLNSTELTLGALTAANQEVAGLVFGDVPDRLDLAERCNLEELPRVTGLDVLGAVPHGVGSWEPARFRSACHSWFAVDSLLRGRPSIRFNGWTEPSQL